MLLCPDNYGGHKHSLLMHIKFSASYGLSLGFRFMFGPVGEQLQFDKCLQSPVVTLDPGLLRQVRSRF